MIMLLRRHPGILASAGILALTEMTQRLGEDHENAQYLAKKACSDPRRNG